MTDLWDGRAATSGSTSLHANVRSGGFNVPSQTRQVPPRVDAHCTFGANSAPVVQVLGAQWIFEGSGVCSPVNRALLPGNKPSLSLLFCARYEVGQFAIHCRIPDA